MADDYGPETYGDRIADVYDAWYGEADFLEKDASIELLAELAGGGPVLELAIGTGRLALPLAERGLEVHGVDASEAMVARLREKPGGADIPVTMGDFADVPVEGAYPLVFVAFNTFFGLPSQEAQVRCFANAAAHLAEGGVFLIEAFVPDLGRFDRNQRFQTNSVSTTEVNLDASRHDPLEQRVDSVHVVLTEAGTRLYPVNLRYAFPAELDLMARLAGLELKHRWGGWRREEFTRQSQRHVSVYGR
jgi:SAM-dependent methyltransferase